MDKFDRQIITLLTQNARRPIAAIGEQIGLSRTAVNDRIRKLEQAGVIKGYTVLLAGGAGEMISAYFELTFRPFDLAEIKHAISDIREIRQAHALTGSTDLMLYVECGSMTRMNEIRQQLSGLMHLDKLQTSMCIERLN